VLIVLTIEPTGSFEWGGVNFEFTARNIDLKESHNLHATMRKRDNTWADPKTLDLGQRIQNIDGVLTFSMYLFCLSLH
jgi:hypothetical protein